MSPAVRWLGFVLLIVAIFLAARQAGALVGPVTHASPGSGSMTGPGPMNMGSGQP